jgi:hypothetical protein
LRHPVHSMLFRLQFSFCSVTWPYKWAVTLFSNSKLTQKPFLIWLSCFDRTFLCLSKSTICIGLKFGELDEYKALTNRTNAKIYYQKNVEAYFPIHCYRKKRFSMMNFDPMPWFRECTSVPLNWSVLRYLYLIRNCRGCTMVPQLIGNSRECTKVPFNWSVLNTSLTVNNFEGTLWYPSTIAQPLVPQFFNSIFQGF